MKNKWNFKAIIGFLIMLLGACNTYNPDKAIRKAEHFWQEDSVKMIISQSYIKSLISDSMAIELRNGVKGAHIWEVRDFSSRSLKRFSANENSDSIMNDLFLLKMREYVIIGYIYNCYYYYNIFHIRKRDFVNYFFIYFDGCSPDCFVKENNTVLYTEEDSVEGSNWLYKVSGNLYLYCPDNKNFNPLEIGIECATGNDALSTMSMHRPRGIHRKCSGIPDLH